MDRALVRLGFTGTRHGMTTEQQDSLITILKEEGGSARHLYVAFHHGSCQRADVEAARAVRAFLGQSIQIICHPGPSGDPYQEVSGVDDVVLPPTTHLDCNRNIVKTCDLLIACPFTIERQSIGGTWYTIDYARKWGTRVIIIEPDGKYVVGVQEK